MSGINDARRREINYDDGDIKTLKMTNETWRVCTKLATDSIYTHRLLSIASKVTKKICDAFSDKPYILHQAQAFPAYALLSAYEAEEAISKQRVYCTHIDDVPQSASDISSHTVYKIKSDDNRNMQLKARISPQGKECSSKDFMESDCAMCSPTGIRFIFSIAALNR